MKAKVKHFCFESICAAMCAVFLLLLMCSGCAMFDLDGNGRFDPVEYLSNADITVTWVDEDGNPYVIDTKQLAMSAIYNYIEMKTGYRFELAPQQDGSIGIMIRDPDGQAIYIVPTPKPPPWSPPPPLR